LVLHVAVERLRVFHVFEEACSSGWAERCPDALPAGCAQCVLLISERVLGEGGGACAESAQVHIECTAYVSREIAMVKREMQDEPDDFPLDEALSLRTGGMEADAGVVLGHRLIPS
jgi:hypothetical protein